jgi:hypothetical protein
MTVKTALDYLPTDEAECWCCGIRGVADKMVHLENHSEVTICTRCAHSLHTWAWEIEDAGKTGATVIARNRFRRLRHHGQQHGWHHNRIVGRPLRWLGKHLP